VGQALADQPITVYGDGTQRRCFCAVADAVPALVDLLEDPRSCGEAFNLGAAEEVSIRELANRVRELTKSTSRIVHLPYEQAYGPGFEDMQRRVPDTTKIRELIGFSPRTSLDEVILSVARHKLGQEVQRAGASRHASPLGAVAQGTLTTDAFRALADPPPKTNRTGGKPS
jgi:UDP-glucose 4-epimerase